MNIFDVIKKLLFGVNYSIARGSVSFAWISHLYADSLSAVVRILYSHRRMIATLRLAENIMLCRQYTQLWRKCLQSQWEYCTYLTRESFIMVDQH